MQKYIKNVKGYDGKTYTIKKYIIGSRSHHFNKRRLNKLSSINYIMSHISTPISSFLWGDDVSLPNDVNPTFGMNTSRHRFEHIATNFAYDAWRYNNLGRSFKRQEDAKNKHWKAMEKLDNEQNDKVAQSWVNEYDDMLPDYINATIINPTIHTVSQFINEMFSKYNTMVHITDKYGKPLNFWHFTELNGKHHCPDDNARWFSQSRMLRCGYSAKNIEWGIKHNSLEHIKLAEEWLPAVNKNIKTVFIVWGENGTNKKDVIKYLAENYDVEYLTSPESIKKLKEYINRFVKTGKLSSSRKANTNFVSLIASPIQAKILLEKYQLKTINGKQIRIIPIKLVMPNQRTVFKRLLRKLRQNSKQKYVESISWIKMLIKKNYALEEKDKQGTAVTSGGNYVKHSAVLLSNNKKRMYQGLDWLMHNKRFEDERDAHCEDTDKLTDKFRDNYENGLRKILTVY